jgi:phage terminase large subunit-like protein
MDAFLNLAGFGARLSPSGERVTMFRAFAALAPAALWAI